MKTKSIIIFLSSLGLIACGGGGGGGGGNNSSHSSSSSSDSQNDTTMPAKTSDLLASQDFLLQSTSHLSVEVAIPELTYQRAYINICHLSEDLSIDYQNCLLNKPFRQGSMQEQLLISNDTTQLAMEVWTYDLNNEPYRYQWHRDEGLDWIEN